MATSIIRQVEDGVEFYTVEATGESGMSVRGLAKLCGVEHSTISRLISNLVRDTAPKRLKALVGNDLNLVREFSKNGGKVTVIRSEACSLIIKHYAFEGSEIAEYSLERFTTSGINTWIQDITGWQRLESPAIKTSVYIQRLDHKKHLVIPDDCWVVFLEASDILLMIEKDWGLPINEFDLLDGSIGKHWSKYRRGKDWAEPARTYTHVFRDRRGNRECAAYHLDELPHFKRWLRADYVPTHLPKYLATKYEQPTLQGNPRYQKFLSS